jgi:hypothetical protein
VLVVVVALIMMMMFIGLLDPPGKDAGRVDAGVPSRCRPDAWGCV